MKVSQSVQCIEVGVGFYLCGPLNVESRGGWSVYGVGREEKNDGNVI